MPLEPSKVKLSPQDADAPWGPDLLERAEAALGVASKRLGLSLDSPVFIRTFATDKEFQQYLQSRVEDVVAVARPRFREIVILRPAWVAENRASQNQTLIHEMVHMLIGRNEPEKLPSYLEEGLAMIVAGQGTIGDSWRILMAGTLGADLSLPALEKQVAIGGGKAQALAYSMSLSVTRFYLHRAYPGPDGRGDPAAFAKDLVDPIKGPNLMRRLWDPNFRYALEIQWKQAHGSIWKWIGVLSGGTLFWTMLSAFVLLAYWRKRRMSRMIRERFTIEEERDAQLGLDIPPWEYGGDDPDDILEDENER